MAYQIRALWAKVLFWVAVITVPPVLIVFPDSPWSFVYLVLMVSPLVLDYLFQRRRQSGGT